MEADNKVLQLQAKDWLPPPGARNGQGPIPASLRRIGPSDTLVSDLSPER